MYVYIYIYTHTYIINNGCVLPLISFQDPSSSDTCLPPSSQLCSFTT